MHFETRDRVTTLITLLFLLALPKGLAFETQSQEDVEFRNKAVARAFYEDLWFSNNTRKYSDYVAAQYIAHDIGDRKGVAEPAIEQKHIADFFWTHGDMDGSIDFQLADGDLVATRWTWRYSPKTWLGRVLHGRDDLPIINVFRFEHGKIVELWNHRHDIDTGMPIQFTLKGLLLGLAFGLVPLGWALTLRRRLRHLEQSVASPSIAANRQAPG